jgi:hypothetical protein
VELNRANDVCLNVVLPVELIGIDVI